MLKQRLIGAAVLIALGVIFIPMLLTGDGNFLSDDLESNVPPKPMYELEAPKVIPLDKRAIQPGEPVVEPASQSEQTLSTVKEGDASSEGSTSAASSEIASKDSAKSEPAKLETGTIPETATIPETGTIPETATTPEAATTDSAVSSKSKSTKPADSPATEKQKVSEKMATSPTPEKPAKRPEPVSMQAEKPVQFKATQKPVVSGWAVQLGSFSVQKNALKLRDSLRKKGNASFVEEYTHNNKTSYRVRVGPELTRELANELKKKLKAETKMDGFVVEFPAK